MAPTTPTTSRPGAREAAMPPRHFANTFVPVSQTPSMARRDTDQVLPYPPPPPAPTFALHASTLAPDTTGMYVAPTAAPALPATTTPATSNTSGGPHGMNIAFVAGAAVAGAILLSVVAGIVTWLVRRNAKRLRREHPQFAMYGADVRRLSTMSSFGGVWGGVVRRSGFGFGGVRGECGEKEEGCQEEVEEKEEMSYSGSFSSPAGLDDSWATTVLASGTRHLTCSVSAPLASGATDSPEGLRKSAEQAHIAHTRLTHGDVPSKSASCNDLGQRQPVRHGLQAIHEDESFTMADGPISTSQPPKNPNAKRFSDPTYSLTSSSPSYTGSIASEGGDVEEAVIVRTAHARSMEIERGVFVTVSSPEPPLSSLDSEPSMPSPELEPTISSNDSEPVMDVRLSAATLSRPPTLSLPDTGVRTSLSADIEESLEVGVLGRRENGEGDSVWFA